MSARSAGPLVSPPFPRPAALRRHPPARRLTSGPLQRTRTRLSSSAEAQLPRLPPPRCCRGQAQRQRPPHRRQLQPQGLQPSLYNRAPADAAPPPPMACRVTQVRFRARLQISAVHASHLKLCTLDKAGLEAAQNASLNLPETPLARARTPAHCPLPSPCLATTTSSPRPGGVRPPAGRHHQGAAGPTAQRPRLPCLAARQGGAREPRRGRHQPAGRGRLRAHRDHHAAAQARGRPSGGHLHREGGTLHAACGWPRRRA